MPSNIQVTRFPAGVTNLGIGSVLENYKDPAPYRYHRIFDDFDTYTAAQWVVTNTGAATQAITTGDGGNLLITNTAANNDLASIQWAGGTGAVSPTFVMEATKDLLFACALQVSNATNAALLVGLAVADTTPIASLPITGMFIYKAAAQTFPQGYLQNASVGTLTTNTVTPMADATQIVLAIHYTAYNGACTFYMGSPTAGGAPSFGPIASAFQLPQPLTLPVAALAPIISLQNGTAAANTMTVDWYFAAKSRVPG